MPSEERHSITGPRIRLYDPVVRWSLRWKRHVIVGAIAAEVLTPPVFRLLSSDFLPPLEEGSLLYMPTTMPGVPIEESPRVLVVADRIIKSFPEVDRVLGKAGRSDSATDPAQSEWRKQKTWYSSWANFLLPMFRHFTPRHLSEQELAAELNNALEIPGF